MSPRRPLTYFPRRARIDALVNPATALESTVQEFLDSCEVTPQAAFADLVNCVFRLCGCNSSLDSDIVVDIDGVVDFLSDVVDEIKGVRARFVFRLSLLPT